MNIFVYAFIVISIIFFTIYICYCGYSKFFSREQITDERSINGRNRRFYSTIRWVESRKNYLCPTWITVVTGLVSWYGNKPETATLLFFFFVGCLFVYCKMEVFDNFFNEVKTTICSTVIILILMPHTSNDFVTYVKTQAGIVVLMVFRFVFLKIYQYMKKQYMEYADLIFALIWIGFLLAFIQRYFLNPELCLSITACIIFIFKDYNIYTFSKYTDYKATSFMIIEAFILLIGTYIGKRLSDMGINPYHWMAVFIIVEYVFFLWETIYYIYKMKNESVK